MYLKVDVKKSIRIISLTAVYDQQIVHILSLAIKTIAPSRYFLSLIHIILIPFITERI
jgi:hypothetical protein